MCVYTLVTGAGVGMNGHRVSGCCRKYLVSCACVCTLASGCGDILQGKAPVCEIIAECYRIKACGGAVSGLHKWLKLGIN